jgi:hypothetical protein
MWSQQLPFKVIHIITHLVRRSPIASGGGFGNGPGGDLGVMSVAPAPALRKCRSHTTLVQVSRGAGAGVTLG